MAVCHTCRAPASHRITGRGRGEYRAATTCPDHHAQTRTWVARAGPPEEELIDPQAEPQRLF